MHKQVWGRGDLLGRAKRRQAGRAAANQEGHKQRHKVSGFSIACSEGRCPTYQKRRGRRLLGVEGPWNSGVIVSFTSRRGGTCDGQKSWESEQESGG